MVEQEKLSMDWNDVEDSEKTETARVTYVHKQNISEIPRGSQTLTK